MYIAKGRCLTRSFVPARVRCEELERALKDYVAWCSHKKAGSGWRGNLGELALHLTRKAVCRGPAEQVPVCGGGVLVHV